MTTDIERVEKAIRKRKEYIRAHMKKGYQFAREQGLSSNEAAIVQGWSRSRIAQYAKDKEKAPSAKHKVTGVD